MTFPTTLDLSCYRLNLEALEFGQCPCWEVACNLVGLAGCVRVVGCIWGMNPDLYTFRIFEILYKFIKPKKNYSN